MTKPSSNFRKLQKSIIISLQHYSRGLVEVFLGQKESGYADLNQASALGKKNANKMILKIL